MRNIRDVDTQLKAPVPKKFNVDCIVEIARGLRIDGDGISAAEIVSSQVVLFIECFGKLPGFFFNVLWKRSWEPEFSNDGNGFDVRIV